MTDERNRALLRLVARVIGKEIAREGASMANVRSGLRPELDPETTETVLQSMVQDGIIEPARSDGTIRLTAEGPDKLRRILCPTGGREARPW